MGEKIKNQEINLDFFALRNTHNLSKDIEICYFIFHVLVPSGSSWTFEFKVTTGRKS